MKAIQPVAADHKLAWRNFLYAASKIPGKDGRWWWRLWSKMWVSAFIFFLQSSAGAVLASLQDLQPNISSLVCSLCLHQFSLTRQLAFYFPLSGRNVFNKDALRLKPLSNWPVQTTSLYSIRSRFWSVTPPACSIPTYFQSNSLSLSLVLASMPSVITEVWYNQVSLAKHYYEIISELQLLQLDDI